MFNFKKKKSSVGNPPNSQRNVQPTTKPKHSLLSLEQRLMFDAAAAATAAEVQSEQVAQEQAEAAVSGEADAGGQAAGQNESQGLLQAIATYSPGEPRTEVVFVDPTVPNYQELLNGMDPHIEVVMLDGGQDGVQQMASSLEGRTGIDAIHIISHGSSGELHLGTGMLSAETMSSQYANDLATIQHALSEQADILVYGCDFAEGEAGEAAVSRLAELTGTDVEASNDLTGHISLGGDWDFEVKTGSIETHIAISDAVQMNWVGVLGTETVKDTFSSTSYSNNNGTQSWSTSWSETDAGGGGASGGDVRVNSGQLRIDTDGMGNAASRGVNLSGATSATLTFSYNNTLTGADRIEARISNDNGATYITLAGGVFSSALNTGSGSASFDISGYASANTRIQFIVTGTGGGDRLYVDNVQVSYDRNTAPTITNLSGDSLSYTEGAGAVVIDQGANALVSDSDSANFDTGALTVSIPVGAEPTEDVLSIRNQGTGAGQIGVSGSNVTYGGVTIGTFSGGAGGNNLVVTFNSNATSTAVTALVKNITYEDINNDSPAEGSFTIRFALTDGDGGTSANYDVSAYVSGVNDAPTDLSLSTNAVAENAATGTVVGTVTGTDPDASDTKTYSLTDAAGGRFAINSSTGVITVANGSLLNYESATSHNVIVKVTDSGGLTYSETFTINLTDVNESAPVITSNGGGATTSVTVSENTTVVTTVTATDADSRQTLTYSIAGGADAAKFTINSATGALSFVSAPNCEAPTDSGGNNIYDVTVQVSDGKGGTATQAIAVTVMNANEAPTDLALSANTVAENASNGTVVGVVTGTDVDAGDTKTYSLTDTAGGRFAINSATGQLTVANGSLLNYESATSHTVTVRVTDAGGQTYDEAFTINLTNVNEGPTGADATVTITEDTPRTLTAANFGFSDVDADDSLSAVRIDTVPSAGSLTLSGVVVTAGQVVSVADITAGRLVFTPAADANGAGYATVAFSVRDNAGSYDAAPNTLMVNVTAVNDAPVLSTNEGGTVDEGGALVLTSKNLQVADIDTPPNELRYTLTSLPANGALLLKGTPLGLKDSFTQEDINNGILEYVHGSKTTVPANDTILLKEAQLSGKDTVAQASIDSAVLESQHEGGETASDSFAFVVSDGAGGNLGESMFKISVTPVNDAPVLSTNEGGTVDEGGAFVLTSKNLQVTDVDTPPNELRYTLTAIPANGALLLKGTPLGLNDSFTQEDINNGILEYAHDGGETTSDRVTFMVDDGAGGLIKESSFAITVNPVNDAPTDLALLANTVVENATTGTVVGIVSGTDVDAGDTKTYTLTDTAGGRFAINANTGVLTVANGSLLNYEASASHTVTVRVTDSGGQSYDETFTINLTNVNEAPTGADATITITEDTPQALTAANFGFSDVDAGDSLSAVRIDTLPTAGTLTLSGVAVTAGQVVSVADITAGRLVFTPTADANGTGYASVTFSVRDSNNAYDTAPNTLTFNVTATNDAPTDLSLSANSVAENAVTGTVVGTITGTDPDSGDTKTYSLTDTAGGRFAINSSTGQLTVANGSLLNYESATSHTVTVRVTDSGGLTYDKTFTIALTNVNEGPTDITLSANTVAENAATGTAVGTVSGTDVDAGDTKTYSLTDTAGGRFAINSATGVLTVADGSLLNYESATSHTVTVRVTDSGGQSYDETFTINLTNVNEAPTDLALSANTVAENAANGTVVGTVSGTDVDTGDTKTYSLTDTAGGRFAINASTGQITVADGSLLNYEANASHSITVRVTDSGGFTSDKTFTINLTNVNEGPTGPAQGSTGRTLAGSPESNTLIAVLRADNPVGSAVEGTNTISELEFRPLDDLAKSMELRPELPLIAEAIALVEHPPHVAHTAVVEQEAVSGGSKNLSTSSGERGSGMNVDTVGTQDAGRLGSSKLAVEHPEEIKSTSDESTGLDMSMAVGLAGVVLQGSTGIKEKMTAMNTRVRALYQKPPSDKKSGQSNDDEEGAVPRESGRDSKASDKSDPA